jgi:phosphoribosylformimino-5-aminoimidazole carboxamide ribotide isomerase
MASIGSVAVEEPEKFFDWLARYGNEKFLLGADVKDRKIAVNGWQTTTDLEILPFLKNYFDRGARQVFCTDISKDGLLEGSANELYAEILALLPELKLIASGGVSRIEDIDELERIGCAGVIIGKAIYEGKIELKQLKRFL